MASTKEIKNRIRSIKNTKKITKAMELVAASKMKKAVNQTLASRPYAEYSKDVLARVAATIRDSAHPYLVDRGNKSVLLVVITSNRGLCGAYNTQVLREVVSLLKNRPERNYSFITIGKKGAAAISRLTKADGSKYPILASFTDMPDTPSLRDILPLANFIISEYEKGTYDRVKIMYTDYVSALTQTPRTMQILPVSNRDIRRAVDDVKASSQTSAVADYVMEPNSDALVVSLIEELARNHTYQMLLESMASEQSARMIAMKNASDAAGEIIDELTLAFNKARQSSITQEISEISAGMASVS